MIVAAQQNHTEVVQMLTESGADLNLQNKVSTQSLFNMTVGFPIEPKCTITLGGIHCFDDCGEERLD